MNLIRMLNFDSKPPEPFNFIISQNKAYQKWGFAIMEDEAPEEIKPESLQESKNESAKY